MSEFYVMMDRKSRFERVIKNLTVTNVFSTLVEELKAIGCSDMSKGESECTEVMVPVAHNDRSPVLLFMGGGMGAGKSTVLKDILDEYVYYIFVNKITVVLLSKIIKLLLKECIILKVYSIT